MSRSSIFFLPYLIIIIKLKRSICNTSQILKILPPPFPVLPIEDQQVIGFSFVSIATLAPSTIYNRATAPPLLGDRTVLAAATPESARDHNNSLSSNLETPLPLTAPANY